MAKSNASAKKIGKQRIKATRKLTKLSKKGRLPSHMKLRMKDVRNQRFATYNKRLESIRDDWLLDRQAKETAEDVGFEETSGLTRNTVDSDDEVKDEEVRSFKEETELLPLIINGQLVKQFRQGNDPEEESGLKKEVEDEDSDVDQEYDESEQTYSGNADPSEQVDRVILLEELTQNITSLNGLLVADPNENLMRLCDLLRLANGEECHPSVSEDARELATASLAEVFVNIIPGYSIRSLSEEEKKQKMKKETKKLANFEQSLLNYYVKYLRLLDKAAMKMTNANLVKKLSEEAFTIRFGQLSVRCLCRLLDGAAHFNYATNIIQTLVHLSISPIKALVEEICEAISSMFKADIELRVSLKAAQAISKFVNQKKCYVPGELIATFLHLNVKDVNLKSASAKKEEINSEFDRKRKRLHGERQSKSSRKFDKQIKKLDTELKEALAAEYLNAKLKYATETMRQVFLTYFRILKRMPTTALLGPVLEGLNKFVHMINVEFFDDLVQLMSRLVEQKQLKLLETLHCIRTTCVILTGEGQALNIDLLKFYRSLYGTLPKICFTAEKDVLSKQIVLLSDCLDILLIKNRKSVSQARVAAFAKRLLLIALFLPSRCAIAILAIVRRIFMAHPSLRPLVEEEDELVGGTYRADCGDPDHSNAQSSTLICELKVLAKHPNQMVRAFALNLLNGVPAKGSHRLEAKWSSMDPSGWLSSEEPEIKALTDSDKHYDGRFTKFCKDTKRKVSSETICTALHAFAEKEVRIH